MKDLFVPYEIAVIAKEKGFDEPCLGYYSDSHKLYLTDNTNGFENSILSVSNRVRNENLISAPLYQQIIEWLKIHDITVCDYLVAGQFWGYGIFKGLELLKPERTLVKAIKEALTLIK